MRLSDALEIGYLDVLEGVVDGRGEARYVPHVRSSGTCSGCCALVFPERACAYCGGVGY